MSRELKRLKLYCDELIACEPVPSLSEDEIKALNFGRQLIREALQNIKEYEKSCTPTSLALMGDFVYATSLMARFLPIFPFQDTHKSHGTELSKKAAKKKAPGIAERKRILENFCVSKGFGLEALARSRNLCSTIAIEKEFISLCEAEGIKVVKGKQLQRYAGDILKERHTKSGHS